MIVERHQGPMGDVMDLSKLREPFDPAKVRIGRPSEDPVKRFWSFVEKTATCWLWSGSKVGIGYGRFSIGYQGWRAHRFSYVMHYGEIPDGQIVRHVCDVPACVRPDHLLLGRPKDNTRDMLRRKRACYGARQPLAKLTDEEVATIRVLVSRGHIGIRAAARAAGVSQQTMQRAIRKQTWKHVQ